MQEKRISSYEFYAQCYSEDEKIIVHPKDYRKPMMFRNSIGRWFRSHTLNNYGFYDASRIEEEESKALEEEFSEIIKQQIAELNQEQPSCLLLDGEIINKITRKENDEWIDIFFKYPLDKSYGKTVEERLLELKKILTEAEIQDVSLYKEDLEVDFPEPLGYVTTKDFEKWIIRSERFKGKLSTEFSNLIKDRITPKSMIEPLIGRLHGLQTLCKEQQNRIERLESQMSDLVDWASRFPLL